MEHAEFVDAWTSGAILVRVDRSKALSIAGSNRLPKQYLIIQLFWIWVCLLTMIAGIAAMFWYRWWMGLMVLVIGRLLFTVTKRAATRFIIEHALKDPGFYRFALEREIIGFRRKS
jgi:hypothetical protein